MPSYQKVQVPSQTKRYQSTRLPQDFSDEEMIRDWTLSLADKQEICRKRLYEKNTVNFENGRRKLSIPCWKRHKRF